MASFTKYPKSKIQPAWRISFKEIPSGEWKQRVIHGTKEQVRQEVKRCAAEWDYFKLNPDKWNSTSNSKLHQVIESFLADKANRGLSSSTITRYRYGLNRVEEALGPDLLVRSISKANIDKIIDYCTDLGQTPDTINTSLRHFTILLNWAYERDLIEKLITIKQIRTQKKKIRWLSENEFNSILEHSSAKLADLLRLYVYTGARRNEPLNAEWKDIDLKAGKIYLHKSKSKNQEYLELQPQAVQILKKYRDSKPKPFDIGESSLRWQYSKACEAAGVESTIHDLRRTTGARLIESGNSIYDVSGYLRHSSVKVTEEHYLAILPSTIKRVALSIKIQPLI